MGVAGYWSPPGSTSCPCPQHKVISPSPVSPPSSAPRQGERGAVALCLVLARAQGQIVTPQRPLWCWQWQQIRCQCCESWWAHALSSHQWDMLGITEETEAGKACDLPHYPGKGFGRTTRLSWLWGKMGHSLQQGIARDRPCPRAQMGPWAGVGHICGCTCVCSQDLPAQPCPRCVSTCAASTHALICDSPVPWHQGTQQGTGKGGVLRWEQGPRVQAGGWGCPVHPNREWGAVCWTETWPC